MSVDLYATRTSNTPTIGFKKLLARIYLAFDESQRQRAAQMIYRYRHLIPDYAEKSMNEKQDRLTVKGIFDHHGERLENRTDLTRASPLTMQLPTPQNALSDLQATPVTVPERAPVKLL